MRILSLAALSGAGALVAIAGVASHRYSVYVGLVVSLALILSAALFARVWRRFSGLTAFASGWVALTLSLIFLPGPGDSTVFIDDARGLTWLIGSSLAIVVVAMSPYRWLEGSKNVPAS